MSPLIIIAWTLLVVAGVLVLIWMGVWFRVWRIRRADLWVRRGLSLGEPEGGWPRLSIIIPAHNEERVIDACATSWRRLNYPDFELIFVLDRCTDETAAILARHVDADERVVIIENESCPEDWAGKCNAVRVAASQATGQRLLFTDADTEADPDLARAAVAIAVHEKLDLFSLLTTLTCRRWFERVVQPVATIALVQLYPPQRVNRNEGARHFANGQFLLFDRERYEAIGGHEAVKDDLLEDIAVARVIHKAGGRIGLRFADGMLKVSMYGSFGSFREGWRRIFVEACHRRPRRLRKNAWQAVAAGVIAPGLQVATLGLAVVVRADHPSLAIAMGAAVGAGWLMQAIALMSAYPLGGGAAVGGLHLSLGMLDPVADDVPGRIGPGGTTTDSLGGPGVCAGAAIRRMCGAVIMGAVLSAASAECTLKASRGCRWLRPLRQCHFRRVR